MIIGKNENKNILIDFTAVWCVNCKKLKEHVFSDDKLKDYINDNYIFIEIDVDKHSNISKRYNVKWLPWIIVIDSNGNSIYTKNKFKNFDDDMADEILNELKQL